MAMTKLVTHTWNFGTTGNTTPNVPFEEERSAYLAEQVAAGKTDGELTEVSPVVFTRVWADQESAEAWKMFIEGLVAKYFSVGLLSVTISDL